MLTAFGCHFYCTDLVASICLTYSLRDTVNELVSLLSAFVRRVLSSGKSDLDLKNKRLAF